MLERTLGMLESFKSQGDAGAENRWMKAIQRL